MLLISFGIISGFFTQFLSIERSSFRVSQHDFLAIYHSSYQAIFFGSASKTANSLRYAFKFISNFNVKLKPSGKPY